MKKTIYILLFLILLIVSFVGGFRFNQHGSNQIANKMEDRNILHYVDPMNPANTSKEPGIAPCGMPMEPVYADEGVSGEAATQGMQIGTVRINKQKQQIIGVQVSEATMEVQSAQLRALGKIVPNENKVYALVAATDGWMGEVHESTTGSLVKKNQLMGKIKIYDYDFYTWQQRYLTELGNAGRRRVYISPLSGAAEEVKRAAAARQKAGSLLSDPGAPISLPANRDRNNHSNKGHNQTKEAPAIKDPFTEEQPSQSQTKPSEAKPPTSWGIPPGTLYYGNSSQPTETDVTGESSEGGVPTLPAEPVPEMPTGSAPELPSTVSSELPGSGTASVKKMSSSGDDSMVKPEMAKKHVMGHSELTNNIKKSPAKHEMNHSSHPGNAPIQKTGKHFFSGEDDILYASKARQELMDLGVAQNQLNQLAETGVYVTYVEIRSPTDGLVLSRNVTTRQRITRGEEYFRIADLSKVWIETDIFDLEERYIQPGTLAKISLPRLNEYSMARVTRVLPRYDSVSRTLKVRLEMDNPGYLFRPDMFVDVDFLLKFQEAITVSSSAVIDSGNNTVVFVVVEEGVFEPRPVITGWRFNDRVEIIKGLNAGEQIVVSGNFLIDSESRMKLAAARLMEDHAEQSPDEQMMVMPTERRLPNVLENTSINEIVIDPICGMDIDPAVAEQDGLTAELQGKTYYFCTEECLREFHRHGPQIEESFSSSQITGQMTDASQHHSRHDMAQMDISSRSPSPIEKQTVSDPVCGMYIDVDAALSAGLSIEAHGKTHYFCSNVCKEDFESNPQHYIDQQMQKVTPGHDGHSHD